MWKQSADSFIDLVRKSRLLSDGQLDTELEELRNETTDVSAMKADQVATYLVDKDLLTQWQADRLREGKHKGFFLRKYKILDYLGAGGMSSVYLAEHLLTKTHCAIKVLPKTRVSDASYLERIYREARAAAMLDNPNVVRVYDMDDDGMIHFLVLEYVDGQNLQSKVEKEGPLNYPVAAEYVRQAARGLSYAHGLGLFHRDVKPTHFMVDRQNVVKVLNLVGAADFSDNEHPSWAVAYDVDVLKAANYLAPEQTHDLQMVDARADIYSLGSCFYFLLTGSPPFPNGTLPQRIMAHRNATPPDIRVTRPYAPADLVKICTKMMAKKPEERFQKASEVDEILTRWLESHGHER